MLNVNACNNHILCPIQNSAADRGGVVDVASNEPMVHADFANSECPGPDVSGGVSEDRVYWLL